MVSSRNAALHAASGVGRQLQRLPAPGGCGAPLWEKSDALRSLSVAKIGLDWMVRGQQKAVPTPGQNVKRYLAGALDVRTGLLTWVEGERKASALFVALCGGRWLATPRRR